MICKEGNIWAIKNQPDLAISWIKSTTETHDVLGCISYLLCKWIAANICGLTTHLLFDCFCRSGIWAWFGWVSCFWISYKTQMIWQSGRLSGLQSYPKTGEEPTSKNPFPSIVLTKFSFLRAVGRCHLSLPSLPFSRVAHNMVTCILEPNKGESLLVNSLFLLAK